MRIIILIQTIIIIVGAYYVYTLSKGAAEQEGADSAISIEVVETPAPTSPQEVEAEVSASTTADVPVSGGNDAGMEYPTLDTEVFPQ